MDKKSSNKKQLVAKPVLVKDSSEDFNEIKAAYKEMKEAKASLSDANYSYGRGNGSKGGQSINSDLQNINDGITPWNSKCDCIDVEDAIILCQKAYWNVSIFRQTIDVQSEFCNSELYFEGSNKAAVKFYEAWDKKINGWNHRDQYFREYFRSSCVFHYRIDSKLEDFEIKRQSPTKRTNSPTVPVRYMLLNPADIKVGNSLIGFHDPTYYKLLNKYEVSRLKRPYDKLSVQEKGIFDSLEEEEKTKLRKGIDLNNVRLKLDPDKLTAAFAKKQDYEPLAVPMYFPVLYDINLKLQLKKAESIIARTIDHAVLLITVGDEDTGAEANQALINEMNSLFSQDSIGRIIVADYTTKMDFVTPDLNKILGAEKYTSVNKDIADGLMNIFFKEEKFSNSSIKIKVFMERLKEARASYLNNFLIPEMERIANDLGFRSVPAPKFKEIDLKDEVEYFKIYNRLAELGLLTPEELFDSYDGKKMPLKEDSLASQRQLKEYKEEGLYDPIIGAKNTSGSENGGGRESGTKVENQSKKPIGDGAKSSRDKFQVEDHKTSFIQLKNVFAKADAVLNKVYDEYKSENKIKRLSEKKKELAFSIAKNIYASEDISDWDNSVKEYVQNPLLIKSPREEILELAQHHQINESNAAFLYYAKIEDQDV